MIRAVELWTRFRAHRQTCGLCSSARIGQCEIGESLLAAYNRAAELEVRAVMPACADATGVP
jgi:hypothetical protein